MFKPNRGTIQTWVLIVIIVLLVGGGIFARQYWGVKKEVKAPFDLCLIYFLLSGLLIKQF